MRFFRTGMIILLAALFFVGCSNIGIGEKPEKQEKAEDATDETTADESGAEGTEPAFAVIPNPYQPGNVPGPAVAEFKRVKALMAASKWQEASGLLNLMIETYPTLSGPYVNLGIVHQKLGESDQAEKALKFAIETNSNNFDAYTQLGILYRELGRFDEAETVYKNALSLWPHHLASVKNLGILYDLYMGRFEEALAYYELSQKILGGEDRQLKGWIADLKRRMGNR